MTAQPTFQFFQGHSLSDLFAQDVSDRDSALLLNYSATAQWAAYPNTQKYFLQDGSSESSKTSFDKICQKEPWKNLAVLGSKVTGIAINPPSNALLNYWRDYFDFQNTQLELLDCATYLDDLSQSDRQVITLFPFDHLAPENHAVDPKTHYHLLSKATLNQLGILCPTYETVNLYQVSLEKIQFPSQFPYLIKTSHGLSGSHRRNATGATLCDRC